MYEMLLFLLLLTGFGMLFYRFAKRRSVARFIKNTKTGMEDAARARLLEKRMGIREWQQKEDFCFLVERELHYSGIRRRFPNLTAEWFLVLELLGISGCFLTFLLFTGLFGAVAGVLILLGLEYLAFSCAKLRELKAVNENLMKLLDFLGNYSITAGEITGMFLQVAKYLEEPLRSALESCYYEAQTTGDVRAAMLAMAEKIEHPKFKELVRNMEISSRYCADLTILVSSSRRSMREYLRMGRERKGMLGDAAINMLLLLLLSLFSLATVDKLITVSIWWILYHTLPGRLAVGVVSGIFLLFVRQIWKLNR